MTDGLVRLHRVVHHDLRPVLRLDDHVGLGDPTFEVTALVVRDVGDEGLLPHRLVGIEQRLEHVPLHLDLPEGCLGLPEGLGGDGGDGMSHVPRLVGQRVEVWRPDHGPDAGRLPRRLEVDRRDARAGVRAPEHRRVQHSGKLDVGREQRVASCFVGAVHTWNASTDGRERSCRPLVERVLVDDDPDFFVAALDFFFGADQSCHVVMASSIFG